MKYNKHFVKWIKLSLLGILFMIVAWVALFSGIIMSCMGGDAAGVIFCYIISIVSIIRAFVFVLGSCNAEIKWKESDKDEK